MLSCGEQEVDSEEEMTLDARGDIPCLNLVHREVMDLRHGLLLNHMDPWDVARELKGVGVINSFHAKHLNAVADEGNRAVNRVLLAFLWRMGSRGFLPLVSALHRTGQSGIAYVLSETEVKVRRLFPPYSQPPFGSVLLPSPSPPPTLPDSRPRRPSTHCVSIQATEERVVSTAETQTSTESLPPPPDSSPRRSFTWCMSKQASEERVVSTAETQTSAESLPPTPDSRPHRPSTRCASIQATEERVVSTAKTQTSTESLPPPPGPRPHRPSTRCASIQATEERVVSTAKTQTSTESLPPPPGPRPHRPSTRCASIQTTEKRVVSTVKTRKSTESPKKPTTSTHETQTSRTDTTLSANPDWTLTSPESSDSKLEQPAEDWGPDVEDRIAELEKRVEDLEKSTLTTNQNELLPSELSWH